MLVRLEGGSPSRLPARMSGVDDGKTGKIVGAAGLFDDGVGVFENLIDGHGVHLATVIVSGLNGVLEIPTGGLGGEVVGDDMPVRRFCSTQARLGMAIQTGGR